MVGARLGFGWVLVLLLSGCGGVAGEALSLGTPIEVVGVTNIENATDGKRKMHGAPWDAEGVAYFNSARAFVVFDLGEVTPIDAVYVQGDNNDRFVIEVSDDGQEFTRLWTAPAVGGGGMQQRWARKLGGSGRFIRLSAVGGDRWVSLSELQVYSSAPAIWPPLLPVDVEMTSSLWAQVSLLFFAVIAVTTALRHRQNRRRWTIAWLATGLAALAMVISVVVNYPPDENLINLARPVAASVAAAVVLRLGFRPEQASQRLSLALLAAVAVLSIAAFYNFGHPQFYDTAKSRPTYVHTFDLRVYFPAVKYVDELGYDGVYLASVKAYADAELDGSLDAIATVKLRDLRDYEMRPVGEIADEIHAVKDRFTPERWDSFTKDMRYFWETMGKDAYLGSLRDHGGNATPAWLLVAYWLYHSTEASEASLLWAALLDPLLLLLILVVVWRTFGARAALVCMVAFGANTIYQFGSNWGGSTLRNDWMALLALGVCALKTRRPFLAGILLGWSAMIRAFPLLALLFLSVPVGWKVARAVRGMSGPERKRQIFEELSPLFKAAAGAVVIAVALGAASSATFGFDQSWGAWSRKISMHANTPNVNHLGVTAVVSFDPDNLWYVLEERGEDPKLWRPLTSQTMKDRRFIIWACLLFFSWLAALALRNLRLSDAALVGTMMIPIYFYPSNYYLHILFVWPLLMAAWRDDSRDKPWALAAATVLVGCAIQWFGWLIPGNYGQFLFWSGVILAMILMLLCIPIFYDRRALTSETA